MYLGRILAEEKDLSLDGEAIDGEAGVLLAQQLRPDVILMDVHLPGINGLEATSRIKEQLVETIVIVLSVDEVYRDAAAKCGADAFLPKFSSISDILALIRRLRPMKAMPAPD